MDSTSPVDDIETDSELECWLEGDDVVTGDEEADILMEDEEEVRVSGEEPVNGCGNGGDEEGGGHEEGGGDEEVNGNNGGSEDDEISPPTFGMEFESALHFVCHVHRYGFANGFQVRIRSSYMEKQTKSSPYCRSKVPQASKHVHRAGQRADKEHYEDYVKIVLVCTKGGLHKPRDPEKPTHSVRTDCKFKVNANKSKATGFWKVSKTNLAHNHVLDRSDSRFLPRYRNISKEDELSMLKNDRAGVRIASNYHTFVVQYKGFARVPFTERDMRNRILSDSRRVLSGGDFNAMECHFKDMKQRDPNFYYEYDVRGGHLVNVFWADGRSIAAAKEFGDVVSFDSTYVTNRYRMPFSPFIAVNHHGNSMLLGCALITREDAISYEWVFGAWVRCMGAAPKAILTDQCKAIGKAVCNVFPSTRHRWCIWHIRRNFTKNMGSSTNWKQLKSEFFKLQNYRLTEEEFEVGWKEWIAKHNLGEKMWCIELYKECRRWAPLFFKNEFWAGMSTTQRSEGMNAFFKGYVDSNTTLSAFLDKYGIVVERRANDEELLTFTDKNRRWSKTSQHVFETVFEELFTAAKYKEIQEQVAQLKNANGSKTCEDDTEVRYVVQMCVPTEGLSRKKNFEVCMNKATMEMKCECCNFEYKGIFCTHSMIVLMLEGIDVVPEKYLYRRWRKDVVREYLKVKLPYNGLVLSNVTPALKRYGEVCKACEGLCLAGMENEELFEMLMTEIKKLSDKVDSKRDATSILTSKMMGDIGKVYGRKGGDWKSSEDAGRSSGSGGVKDPPDLRRSRGRPPTVRKGAELDQKIASAHKRKAGKRKATDSTDKKQADRQPTNVPQHNAVFGAPPFGSYLSPYCFYPSSTAQIPMYHMNQASMEMPPTAVWMAPPYHPSFPSPRYHPIGSQAQSPCTSSPGAASSQMSSDQMSDGMLRMRD